MSKDYQVVSAKKIIARCSSQRQLLHTRFHIIHFTYLPVDFPFSKPSLIFPTFMYGIWSCKLEMTTERVQDKVVFSPTCPANKKYISEWSSYSDFWCYRVFNCLDACPNSLSDGLA